VNPPAGLEPAHEAALGAVALALAQARSSGGCTPLIAALAGLHALLPGLPAAFGPVLEGIEQRLQSSAMFGEESCSFSLHDLFDSLDTWLERARMRLLETAARSA
jgi:hypothetical protein